MRVGPHDLSAFRTVNTNICCLICLVYAILFKLKVTKTN